jgi:hypothetical protein
MRGCMWLGTAVLFMLSAASTGQAGEHYCCPPPEGNFLQRVSPVGGWDPYGGCLLRWWPRHCFPCVGAPDDYCRKPLPRLCWPPYPPYYQWGPPEICCPRSHGCGPHPKSE